MFKDIPQVKLQIISFQVCVNILAELPSDRTLLGGAIFRSLDFLQSYLLGREAQTFRFWTFLFVPWIKCIWLNRPNLLKVWILLVMFTNMHQDVSIRISWGSRCCESMFFFKSELLASSSWSRSGGPKLLSPRNLNVFRPKKQVFCNFMLLLSDLKTRLWFSTTHRLFWPSLTFTQLQIGNHDSPCEVVDVDRDPPRITL